MSFLKQETKIGESHTGVSAVPVLTPGIRVRIGMCVIYFSDFFTPTYSSYLSPSRPALHLFTLPDCRHS